MYQRRLRDSDVSNNKLTVTVSIDTHNL